ncbi:MAG: HD domain-containing protein [Methanolinea sp.]|nr:HD domain-containing protein [Methanolinea sp.]
MGTKIIKDPVHGYVEVESPLLPLLDLPVLQRLRYIRQLGFSYLVYPGAHHTRFEHSLGTMHLAGVMAHQLRLPAAERALVTAAALLHDIGHGPFSHAIEPLSEEFLGIRHHDVQYFVCEGKTREALESAGIDPGDVVSVVQGRHPLSGIIHGDLDVDRMDYLLRDAHYTGAPYGTVDAHRLIRSISLEGEKMVLAEAGVQAAESLLIARTLMRPSVYFHHVSRIGEMMFQEAVMAHVGDHFPERLLPIVRGDDSSCMQALLTSPHPVARELACRIYERRLFKRALSVGQDQVNAPRLAAEFSYTRRREISARIAELAGVPAWCVMVDIPPFPGDLVLSVPVRNRTRTVPLSLVSPLVHTLSETRRAQWKIGVYTLPETRGEVSLAASEILHVKPPTTQEMLFPVTKGPGG